MSVQEKGEIVYGRANIDLIDRTVPAIDPATVRQIPLCRGGMMPAAAM